MSASTRVVAVLLLSGALTGMRGPLQWPAVLAAGSTVSGRVLDPHNLSSPSATLMLMRLEKGSTSSMKLEVSSDGSFVSPPLAPGAYVLSVLRAPHAFDDVLGLTVVRVGTADVRGVTVAVRRDASTTGRIRLESDDPDAQPPPSIVVNAFLALDDEPLVAGRVAAPLSQGTFVLRNVFGPRVLRCGYQLADGSPWWPSRVTLNGKDISNTPTDFGDVADGQLEVVFTQHLARFVGVVTDHDRQPVRYPWVVFMGIDAAAVQPWATTAEVIQGDAVGRFSAAMPSGTYRIAALPAAAFPSSKVARLSLARIAFGRDTFTLAERERKVINPTMQER